MHYWPAINFVICRLVACLYTLVSRRLLLLIFFLRQSQFRRSFVDFELGARADLKVLRKTRSMHAVHTYNDRPNMCNTSTSHTERGVELTMLNGNFPKIFAQMNVISVAVSTCVSAYAAAYRQFLFSLRLCAQFGGSTSDCVLTHDVYRSRRQFCKTKKSKTQFPIVWLIGAMNGELMFSVFITWWKKIFAMNFCFAVVRRYADWRRAPCLDVMVVLAVLITELENDIFVLNVDITWTQFAFAQ